MTTEIELDQAPNLAGLYGRAVVPGGGGGGDLPDTRVVRRAVDVDRDDVAAYSRVCGFRLRDELPPTYLHMLAFPLSIHLMAGSDFPFPLLGMVHLHQGITVHRPITADEVVGVAVEVADLRPHRKGQQFDVLATVTAAGTDEVVWAGRSVYLHRSSGDDQVEAEPRPTDDVDVAALPWTADWDVPSDIGRRYGKVSGDVNPIHLSSVTAKPLGFDRHIAHGMWTMARAVAGLEGRLPGAVTIDTSFKTPLSLPKTVAYATERLATDSYAFGVRDDRSGKPHLAGVAVPA